ncbi:hypothetical protein LPJ53_001351 [Coemansia erecta]|uniref:Uncharacterized protein n=1 Tax=Coemansia erecta TaxID=147472 RepID=A0A9W7Y6N6_9FUNG|nr:hypothetical protein LPJ53_001351 [Coemansia erecta]
MTKEVSETIAGAEQKHGSEASEQGHTEAVAADKTGPTTTPPSKTAVAASGAVTDDAEKPSNGKTIGSSEEEETAEPDIVASENSAEELTPTTAIDPPSADHGEKREKLTAKESAAAEDSSNDETSDQDDFASINAISDAMQDVVLADDKPAANALTGAIALPTSDNVDVSVAGPSPTDVATAILLKDTEAARAFGARGFQGSGESDRTAIGQQPESSNSPRSSGSKSRGQPEIAELSDDENSGGVDGDDYDDEDIEERQRRLFRLAERRRQQKEKMAQNTVSSGEIEIMRSGLSSVREYTSPSELRILNGSYPEGLRGSLYAVGPGRFEVGYNVQRELEQATRMFTFGHLMDVPPLLTKVSFDPKQKTITHRSRLIAKQMCSRIQAEHGVSTKVPGALYMSDTNQTFLNKFIPKASHYSTPEGECCGQDIQLFMPLQGSSQNIVCTNHVGALQNIDPVDLRPRAIVELKDVNPEFKGLLSCPHMQYDSDTREHFTVLQDVGFRSTTYTVVAISESQPEGYTVASFSAQASVLHSFAITQDYIIVPVYPYAAPIGGVSYRWGDSLLETLSFDHAQPAYFFVISREYRRVQCVYQAPAFFAMHHINAVQESATDSISIDLIAYEDDAVLRRLMIKDLRRPSVDFSVPSGYARRYQLSGVTMEATKYIETKGRPSLFPWAHTLLLRTESIELAKINPMVSAKPYTYMYGLSHVERLQGLPVHVASTTMYNCIVKLDSNDGATKPLVWSRKHCYPSEPVFVPHSDKEDDGFIVSIFFDSMRITSCIVVLDAKTFKELMIAQLPSAVPLSFGHSKFAI